LKTWERNVSHGPETTAQWLQIQIHMFVHYLLTAAWEFALWSEAARS